MYFWSNYKDTRLPTLTLSSLSHASLRISAQKTGNLPEICTHTLLYVARGRLCEMLLRCCRSRYALGFVFRLNHRMSFHCATSLWFLESKSTVFRMLPFKCKSALLICHIMSVFSLTISNNQRITGSDASSSNLDPATLVLSGSSRLLLTAKLSAHLASPYQTQYLVLKPVCYSTANRHCNAGSYLTLSWKR